MDSLLQDLRYALRTLLRSPGFTATAVLTLTLGIGATTTIFSMVSALLVNALPLPDRDRLVQLWHVDREGAEWEQTLAANYLALREGVPEFDALAAYASWPANLGGRDGAERVNGFHVSPDFFATLGIRPSLGRGFTPGEEDRVAVLSEDLWRRRFAADPSVLGKPVALDGNTYTVVGVVPAEVTYPTFADLWVPARITPEWGQSLTVVGRLRPGIPPERAQARATALLRRLALAQPDRHAGAGITVRGLHAEEVQYLRTFLGILLTAAGFLLLIACTNVANLVLARAAGRGREIAIRTALGAGRGRIVRQLLTESVVLALVGGTLGALVAFWGVEVLKDSLPTDLTRFVAGWAHLGVDGRVLVFTLAVSVAAGALFGLAPALGTTRPELTRSLKDGERSATRGRGRLRRALVVAEVALALVLLAGATLMTRSFVGMLSADPGFRADRVLTMEVALQPAPEGDPRVAAFQHRLLERVRGLPGVLTAGLVSYLPMSRSGAGNTFTVEGRPVPADGEAPWAQQRAVTPGYLETLRIPVLRGRGFTGRDAADAPRVALVNGALARRYFPGGDPIGKRVRLWGEVREVVGVVGDVHHYGVEEEVAPELYVPQAQSPTLAAFLTVRTEGDPTALAAAVRREAAALDPDAAIGRPRTLERVVSDFVAHNRVLAGLLGGFAALAVLIAAVGVYGVIAYSVAQRTREFGVRLALGAEPRHLVRAVVRQGAAAAGTGIAIGLAGAFGVTRFLAGMLYGVSPSDPATFAGVALLLGAVALLASYVPARRATRVDPVVALRAD